MWDGYLMVFGVSLAAVGVLYLATRFIPLQVREAHNEVLGFVYAVVGVIYAVVLAMTVIGGWDAIQTGRHHTYMEASGLSEVYWYASTLPEPQQAQIQDTIREYVRTVVSQEWELMETHQASDQAWALAYKFRGMLEKVQTQTPAEQSRYEQALMATQQFFEMRRVRVNEADHGVPVIMWVGLILGGMVTLLFAILFGMKNFKIHAVMVFSLTALTAFMLLLVWELNYPFSGPVRVGPQAFELTMKRLALIR